MVQREKGFYGFRFVRVRYKNFERTYIMQKIVIEKVSENMADATVGRWHAPEGTALKQGDPVVDLVTEKATFEIEAEQDGILKKQYATEKSIVPVGFVVCIICTETEEIPAEIEENNSKLISTRNITVSDPSPAPSPKGPKIKATPAARRKAKKSGIDLPEVKSRLCIDGVITEKNIDEYLALEE